MRFSILSVLTAGLATLASAQSWTQPKGPVPKGNPISKPGLNEIVHKGAPYQITWNPTTKGTVTLLLLRGPSENVKPLYAIAQKIPNTGSFTWTPAKNLELDTTHYGIQLIVDKNGQYQYSTQFGIGKKQRKAGRSERTDSEGGEYDVGEPHQYEQGATSTLPVYGDYEPTTTADEGYGSYGSSTSAAEYVPATTYAASSSAEVYESATTYAASSSAPAEYQPTTYAPASSSGSASTYQATTVASSGYVKPTLETSVSVYTTTKASEYAPVGTSSTPSSTPTPTAAAGKVGYSLGAAGVVGALVAVVGL